MAAWIRTGQDSSVTQLDWAFEIRAQGITKAFQKPESFQAFKQSLWSLTPKKIQVIQRWIELMFVIQRAENKQLDPIISELSWSGAKSFIALDADEFTAIANNLENQPPDEHLTEFEHILLP